MRRLFYRLIAWLSSDDLPRDGGDFRLIDRCVLDLLCEYRDENPYLRATSPRSAIVRSASATIAPSAVAARAPSPPTGSSATRCALDG
jgi:hypothetical protein